MTNQELRDQIEALKLQKELAELKAELAVPTAAPTGQVTQPKAPQVAKAGPAPRVVDGTICERTDYKKEFKGDRRDINLARTRCYGVVAWHLACAPVASFAYSAKNGRWGATIAATSLAAVGVPLALLDGGTTTLIAAPVTSMILHVKSITDQRKRLNITTVSQADAMKFSSF